MLVLKGLVGLLRTVNFSFFSIAGWNGLPWKRTDIILSFVRLHPSTAFWTLVDHDDYSISSKGFLPAVVDIMAV